ncbi:iron complex outermembrane receptor protein [Sphingomonas vulcanisoli]|uniref:Iron complex outermembrane receptor protein n=1 Tax=Sphingomonas vulcanisoli TaxID=1658060 RepID=A0ABX0TTL5_9SPHN|nr:TonB-dependent receptor [Sphingomonas vulcanisoli]NIJ08403.1 iron complex outermembrane receptor protein [Sphingomonas vulcanisoli]
MGLKSFSIRALAIAGVSMGAMIAPVAAQDTRPSTPTDTTVAPDGTPDGGGQDIVVTARRRSETLLNVPIAVTAFSGEKLAKSGAVDLTDIQNVTPNTTLKDARGTNSTLAAFIRGVGQQDPVPGFEAGVGIYLDDVYLNRPQASVLDIYDVDRIEVLRGPQGTLYGRNTIGGAVKYVTKRLPDHFEVNLKGTYGSYNQLDGIVGVSSPVGDLFKIGLTGARLTRDGFGKNLTLGIDNYNKDIWAGRGTVEFQSPDRRLFARFTADYTDDKSNARNGHRLIPGLVSGAPVLSNVYDTQAGLNSPVSRVKGGGGSMTFSAELSDHFTLKSISAYRADKSRTPIDFDALPSADVDVPAIYINNQTSQEFQLAYKSDKLNGLIGYYYLGARARTGFDVLLYTTGGAVLPGLDAYTRGDVRTETHSVFGDFTYDFTPQISLSLGGRYTWDERKALIFKANYLGGPTQEFGGNPTIFGAPLTNFLGKANFKKFTPRASLSYKITPDHMIYASFSEGFKGGGFDPRGSGASAPISNPAAGRTYQDIYNYLLFKPETVKSYEIGWKGALMDHRLTFALDGFYADYTDVQIPGSVGAVVNGVQTFIGITTNAAKAHIKGVEFEGNAVLARGFAGGGSVINAAGTVGYIDPKYVSYIGPTGTDISNVRQFQNTPHWTASATLSGTVPMAEGASLSAGTTASYRSLTHQFETASPFLDQAAYTLIDANITYAFGHGRYSIGVYGKNLTNRQYKTSGYQYINSTLAGVPILNAAGGYTPTLGKEGIATAFYGNPRQVLGTFTAKF